MVASAGASTVMIPLRSAVTDAGVACVTPLIPIGRPAGDDTT